MKIELLQGRIPAAEQPGIDSTDPRFDDIVTLTQAGKHLEAAQQCEAIITEGIFDIRLICYFLYGHFLELGLASLQPLNQTLCHLVQDNWAAIGPLKNREKNLEKSLDWLFRQIIKKCKYEESKQSPEWLHWQSTVTKDEIESIGQTGKALRRCLIAEMEDKASTIIDQWSKIEQWLQMFQQLLPKQAVVPVEPEPEPEPDVDPKDAVTPDNTAPECASLPVEKCAAKTAQMNSEGSYHLQQLLKKLAGFDRMVAEQKFDRAVLLADDINQLCQSFDPKLYFPNLFETFVRLQAIHLEELTAYVDHRGTQEWECLKEWLKVDPDSFIDYP